MASQTLNVIEDAHERNTGTGYTDSNSSIRMDDGATIQFIGGFYFELSTAIPSGATIDNAYITLEMNGTGEPDVTIHMEDVADADDFTTTADVASRTPTTAGASWSDSGLTGSQDSPSIAGAIQELVDTYTGLASGAGVMVLVIPNGNGTTAFRSDSLETGSGTPADLYIEWTEAGGGGSPQYYYSQL